MEPRIPDEESDGSFASLEEDGSTIQRIKRLRGVAKGKEVGRASE